MFFRVLLENGFELVFGARDEFEAELLAFNIKEREGSNIRLLDLCS